MLISSVIKLNNGYLNYLGYGYLNYVNYEQNLKRDYLFCEQYAERISLFQKRLQSEKIPVVFVMAPGKSHIIDLQIPRGCKPEITNILADYLLKKLEEKKVPFFDTRSIFKENSDEHYRLFFKGDHHWKPEYALIAYQKFWKLYSDKISEIPNVNLDWINHIQRQQFPFNLGEQFQINQSGEYYTDYEQSITHYMPQFDTDITVSIPYQKYLIRENFESSGVSDYYMHNPPLKYSINHKIKYGKIVLIKDSFGLPWFGFLTLSTHETYMFDLRSYRSSPESYIKNIQPDIVIILYHPGALSDHENYSSAFNF